MERAVTAAACLAAALAACVAVSLLVTINTQVGRQAEPSWSQPAEQPTPNLDLPAHCRALANLGEMIHEALYEKRQEPELVRFMVGKAASQSARNRFVVEQTGRTLNLAQTDRAAGQSKLQFGSELFSACMAGGGSVPDVGSRQRIKGAML